MKKHVVLLKRIFVIMCIISVLCPSQVVLAKVDKAKVQKTIASFAINTYNNSGTEFSWSNPDYWPNSNTRDLRIIKRYKI